MVAAGRNGEEGDESLETSPLIPGRESIAPPAPRSFMERYSQIRNSQALVKLLLPGSNPGGLSPSGRSQADDPVARASALMQEGRNRGSYGDMGAGTGRTSGRSTGRSMASARFSTVRSASASLSRTFSARMGGPQSALDRRGSARDRLPMKTRKSSTDSVYSTAPFSPGGNGSQQASARVRPPEYRAAPTADFRETLAQIRSADGSNNMSEEQPMPHMPKAYAGFRSTAHLRNEDYWQELLGRHDKTMGPCRWVEDTWFCVLVALAVFTNALLVSVPSDEAPSWYWWAMQTILLVGFTEMAARLVRWRRGLRPGGPQDVEALAVILVDATALVGIASLLWGEKLVKALHGPLGSGPDLGVCIFSLLRLTRLVHIVPGLQELARGIMDAFQGLFWVLVLMGLMLYATAIVCTRLIGHAEFGGAGDSTEAVEAEDAHHVREAFSDIISSMFVLFQVQSQWSLRPLMPLFKAGSEMSIVWQICFSAFYIFSGWMLVAVMTGTVSFTMIAMRARIVGEDAAREEQRRNAATEHILKLFRDFDLDHSGEISHKELQKVLEQKEIQHLLKQDTNIQADDLEELYFWIDADKSGSVSFQEFETGFRWLNDSFKTRNLLRLREKVTKDLKRQIRRMQATISSSFDGLKSEVDAPSKKLHALSEQVQLAHIHAVDTARCHEAPRAIADLESRVGEQVEAIVARAEKLALARWGDEAAQRSVRRVPTQELVSPIRSLKCEDLGRLSYLGSEETEPEDGEVPIQLVPSVKAVMNLDETSSMGSRRSRRSGAASEHSRNSPVPLEAMTSMKSTLDMMAEISGSSLGSKPSKASKASQGAASAAASGEPLAQVGAVASMKSALELDIASSVGGSVGAASVGGAEPVPLASQLRAKESVSKSSLRSSGASSSASSRSSAPASKASASKPGRTASSLSRRSG